MTSPQASQPTATAAPAAAAPADAAAASRAHATTSTLQSAFPERLVTPRTELRVSDPAFAPQFAEFIQHSIADLSFIAGWRDAADERVARDSLNRSIELAHIDVVRHVFLRTTGDYIGRLDLHSWQPDVPRCELGFMGNSRFTGRGLLREAAMAMLDAAWGLDVRRVQATCDTRNHPAIRFAQAIGMQREGVLHGYERDDDGHLCDTVMFAIVRP
jgi:RimJ/RimL family protein N-acetyltransferase